MLTRLQIMAVYYLVELYYTIEYGYCPNDSYILYERPSNKRRKMSTNEQIVRMTKGYWYPYHLLYDHMSPAQKGLFHRLIERWNLPEFEN